MSKRIQCIAIMCIVISISLCPFLSVSSYYETGYIDVVPAYPYNDFLPFGADNTLVVQIYNEWYFMDATYMDSTQNLPVFLILSKNQAQTQLIYVFRSQRQISHYTYNSRNNTWTFEAVGTLDSVTGMYTYTKETTWGNNESPTILSNKGYLWIYGDLYAGYNNGTLIPQVHSMFPATQNYGILFGGLSIRPYPDSINSAIDTIISMLEALQADVTTISDNLDLYYSNLDSKLDTVIAQNRVLNNKITELQSQLSEQGTEYQSALNQAQSEIQSNVNSAAQSAADDVNNAGSDVEDLDDNMDDVNGIVETLDGWIEDLDDFADSIDDSITSVSVALTNANAVINGFFGACPPIVLALFGFALVFLVVRKIIGR